MFVTGVVDTGGKFAAGVVDTGGKFATCVVDRVRRVLVEGCGVDQLRMQHGSVERVWRGSVSVRLGSVQGAP